MGITINGTPETPIPESLVRALRGSGQSVAVGYTKDRTLVSIVVNGEVAHIPIDAAWNIHGALCRAINIVEDHLGNQDELEEFFGGSDSEPEEGGGR